MTTWVLLLRGINVGGRNRLPMRDLAALLEGMGLGDVRTLIQSGNVVFTSDDETPVDPTTLTSTITAAIREAHGIAPRAMLLTAAALRVAIEANPFPEADAEPATVHLFFLDGVPAAPDLAGLEAVRAPRERFAIDNAVFYLHAPDGLGRSKLAERAERLLGVAATARNWSTVSGLARLAAGMADT
ncbi:MAG TPA: DUF1697 domain-containing protein [Candidatus Limnocylindrales bacterium]|nr:DUF1697 domain-containing protein [Candidatus Limnocylindrales bacterium]